MVAGNISIDQARDIGKSVMKQMENKTVAKFSIKTLTCLQN